MEKFPIENNPDFISNSQTSSSIESTEPELELNPEGIKSLFKKLISNQIAYYEFEIMISKYYSESRKDNITEILSEVLVENVDLLSKFLVRIREEYAHHRSEVYDLEKTNFDNIVLDIFDDLTSRYINKPKTPYFLNLQLEYTNKSLQDDSKFVFHSRRKIPFQISKDWYAWVIKGNLHFAKADDELKRKIESYQYNENLTYSMTEEARYHARQTDKEWFEMYRRFELEEDLDEKTVFRSVSEEALDSYEIMTEEDVRLQIEKHFNFSVKNLNIREQFYFLNYLKQVTNSEAGEMQVFTQRFGVNGMRTFLSLERGDETLGDHIVAFGQHEEIANTVFQYYGELLDKAEQAEKLVQEAGCDKEHCLQLAEQVRENILNRAQKDLETAVQTHDPSEVAAKIETYAADAKVYVALLQEAIQEPLEAIPASKIAESDKNQIMALSARNYTNESEDFQTVIRSGLETALESENTHFYIEHDKSGRVIFCDRFDHKVDRQTGREVKYFGSVNAEPAFNGIGRVRISETLEQEMKSGEAIFGHCDPKNAVSSLYIELGFVATRTVSPAGKFSFEIWRSSDSSEQLPTKQLSTTELLEQFEKLDESVDHKIRRVEQNDQFTELSEGKYLTRYFRYNGEYYAVFEPAPASLKAEFVPPHEEKEAA